MAKARALDKRRKSVRNIRKITRTMELIATARFKKAMDRASAATAYTKRITQAGGRSGHKRPGSQPSAAWKPAKKPSARSCWCSPAIAACAAATTPTCCAPAWARYNELKQPVPQVELEISGKRGIAAFKFREIAGRPRVHALRRQAVASPKSTCWPIATWTNTSPASSIGSTWPTRGSTASSRQTAVVETLLPLGIAGERRR